MTRGVGGHGSANVMKHLKGIHFPVDKERLLSHARKGPGPDTREVLKILQQIPDKHYSSPSELIREIGKVH